MRNLSNCTVMVVDDVESNIDILVEVLGDSYEISVAMDGETALQDIIKNIPDLVLLDVMMPGIDGYEVCKKLKENPKTAEIPVIFLTALSEEEDEAKGLALGAVDYITKPFVYELVKSRVRNQLELKLHRDHLEDLVRARTRELELTQEVTIGCLGTLAEYRDPETGGHISRTQVYVRLLADYLNRRGVYKDLLDDATIELLYKSAPLHDIGKVGVPDDILLKPGKLTDEEFEEIKKHTAYGSDVIASQEKKLGVNSFLTHAKEIAGTHHEKWDGTGYPLGISGNQIPISGRIMAVADVYDALISKRVYKPPFSHKKAVEIILDGRGSHFDPDVVDAFVELEEQFRQAAIKFADFEEEREALSKIDE